MAYRIVYEETKVKPQRRDKASLPVPLLSLLFFLVFLMLIGQFWPEGASWIRNALIPGDPDKTMQALQVLSRELHSGVPIGAAVEDFCKDIITGAGSFAAN